MRSRHRRHLRLRRHRPGATADALAANAGRGPAGRLAVDAEGTGNGHIANCIRDCRWLWTTGSSEGVTVYDMADPANPRHLGAFQLPGQGFTHDVEVDAAGIAWVTGRTARSATTRPRARPAAPAAALPHDDRVVNSGNSGPISPDTANDYPLDFLHHNSQRIAPRVMAITEEDYTRPGCPGQGSLQTWQMTPRAQRRRNAASRLLDMFTTDLNELAEARGRSNPYGAPTTVNCSAHWFDHRDGLIAQGWYDQGIRFLDVSDPRDIRQVGYFVTPGTFWAAYFAPTDPTGQTVYAPGHGGRHRGRPHRPRGVERRAHDARPAGAGAVRPRRRGGRRGPLRRRPPVRPRLPAARGRRAAPAAMSRPQPSGSAFAVCTPRSSRATRSAPTGSGSSGSSTMSGLSGRLVGVVDAGEAR